MANSFSCPSCGAPLDYHGVMTTIQCPYCFTSSQVPEDLRANQGTTVEPGVMLNFMAQATKLRELAAAVKAGQKQKAAELYQQIYRVSADEAARSVTKLTGGGAVLVSGYQAPPMPSLGSSFSSMAQPPSYATPPPPPAPPPSSVFTASPSFTPDYMAGSAAGSYPPITPSPSQTRTPSRLGPLFVILGILVSCVIVGALAGLLFAFSGDDSDSVTAATIPPQDTTQIVLSTRKASAATEQSQAGTQIALKPTSTPVPTNTQDPRPGQTATAQAFAQATEDTASVLAAKKWPIFYQEDFAKDSPAWFTGPEENDYYSGSHTISEGVFRWDLTAKENFVSYISPDPYQSVSDFYAATDVTLTGSQTSAAGLSFRGGRDTDSGYFIFVVSLNGHYTMTGSQGGTQISYNGDIPPLQAGPNRIAVLGQGTNFILLVNDQIVTTVQDSFLAGSVRAQGDTGLAVTMENSGDTATIDFDNFEIRTP
jgi:hypothetical protein